MNETRTDAFIVSSGKYFEGHHLIQIRETLLEIPEEKWPSIMSLQFKDPTMILIVSLLGGSLGIDRFLIGDTGLGIAKLLTCGGLGIWSIVDLFLIMGVTRERNTEKLRNAII